MNEAFKRCKTLVNWLLTHTNLAASQIEETLAEHATPILSGLPTYLPISP